MSHNFISDLIFFKLTIIDVAFFNDFFSDFLLFIIRQLVLGEVSQNLADVSFTDELCGKR